MSWKKTDLERLKAASITDQLRKAQAPARYGRESAIPSRREQREAERAQGLVPFAVKLNGDLVKKLQARAHQRQVPLDQLVAELLDNSLK